MQFENIDTMLVTCDVSKFERLIFSNDEHDSNIDAVRVRAGVRKLDMLILLKFTQPLNIPPIFVTEFVEKEVRSSVSTNLQS